MKRSHITIPNSILLRFKNLDNTVTAYNFDTNEIREVDVYRGQVKDTVNYEVAEGYYSEFVEEYFSKYEGDMGRLHKDISDFRNAVLSGNEGRELDISRYRELLITIIALSTIRKPEFLKGMLWDNSVVNRVSLIDFETYKNNYVYIENSFNSMIEKYKELLTEYSITISIIDENCKKSFALTKDLIQSFGKRIYVILSPTISVMLYPREEIQTFNIDGEYEFYEIIRSDEEIENFTQNLVNNMKISKTQGNEVLGLRNQLELIKILAMKNNQ